MLKQQYELRKMMAAYIGAEQQIIQNSPTGMADGMTPEQFHIEFVSDEFGNVAAQHVTVKDLQLRQLEEQLEKMEEQGRNFLEREEYELMQELKEIYEITKKQIENLKRGT